MTETHDAWRDARRRAVTAPTGNLALIETRWGADRPAEELPPTVTVTTLQRRSLLTGGVEHGIRLWDAASPAIEHFVGIDTYPYDPAWVVPATFRAKRQDVAFEHKQDAGRTRALVVPGDLHVTIAGREYTLSAFDDDGRLLLVFGDPTNGVRTYGSGRFLFVDPAAGVLDFNRAFVPPCGFSEHYNCPMPPPQNRIAVPVEAGEKLPVFRDGFSLGDTHQ